MSEIRGWKHGPLSQVIASLDTGVSVNAEDRPHGAGEIGILKTSALTGGVFRPEQNKAVLVAERALVTEPVAADSVLVSRMNTPALVGESCYVTEEWPTLFVPDRIWQLKQRDEQAVSMRWLSYVLRSAKARAHIETHATGTSGSMKNLAKGRFLDLTVDYPPVVEQRSIAQVLDTLDTTIRQTQALIAKLKLVKQGLLHDLLTRGIAANGELRPPQSEAPHLYKASPLGWVPCEWSVSSVATVFDVTSGLTLGPHRTPHHRQRKYLRVANVQRYRIDLTDVAELDATDAEMKSKQLLPGDLLVVEGHASTDEIGRCAMADDAVRGYTFQNHLFRLRAVNMDETFALHWMNSDFVRAYWRVEAATSSGLNTINRTKLDRLSVAVPPLTEQKEIVVIVKGAERRLELEQQQLAKLMAQKSGLMDDLLTGRVRVTPLLKQEVTT
jgi:type I restriction enzyme S subunit